DRTQPSSTTRPAEPKSVSCCGTTLTPASDGATRSTSTPSGEAHGTRNRSASGAASTAVFTPVSTQCPSARSARAEGTRGSSPSSSASAAVSTTEPCHAGAAHLSCCAAVPKQARAPAPSTIEARYGTLEAERPNSISTEHCSSSPRPAPPSDKGNPAASTPAAARSPHGASCSARIFLVRPASSVCSSVKPKSMPNPRYRRDATYEKRAARDLRPR